MKTKSIQQQIISNFNILSEKTNKIKPQKKNFHTIWGLQYRPKTESEGSINEIGRITRKNTVIKIENNKITKINKSNFSTWGKALVNINKMLEDMVTNFNNCDIVKPKFLDLLIFPKDFLK